VSRVPTRIVLYYYNMRSLRLHFKPKGAGTLLGTHLCQMPTRLACGTQELGCHSPRKAPQRDIKVARGTLSKRMKRLAVPGMNCHSPAAPTFDYAARLNEDSTSGYAIGIATIMPTQPSATLLR
jgi:hypothetical protein